MKFANKVRTVFWTQLFNLGKISYQFVSFINEIFCSAQISQLPILSYGCMARSTTKSCPLEGAPLGFAPDSLQNNWLALKNFAKTNTLAYFATQPVTKKQSFYNIDTCGWFHIHFTLVTYGSSKLSCMPSIACMLPCSVLKVHYLISFWS